jgi:lactobin A/cerein 7B family class IIb bacteriocin
LNGKNELSEEDLKKVAGGYITVTGFVLAAMAVGAMVGGGAAGAAAVEGKSW